MKPSNPHPLAAAMSGHPSDPLNPRHQLNNPKNLLSFGKPGELFYANGYGDGGMPVPVQVPVITANAQQQVQAPRGNNGPIGIPDPSSPAALGATPSTPLPFGFAAPIEPRGMSTGVSAMGQGPRRDVPRPGR